MTSIRRPPPTLKDFRLSEEEAEKAQAERAEIRRIRERSAIDANIVGAGLAGVLLVVSAIAGAKAEVGSAFAIGGYLTVVVVGVHRISSWEQIERGKTRISTLEEFEEARRRFPY